MLSLVAYGSGSSSESEDEAEVIEKSQLNLRKSVKVPSSSNNAIHGTGSHNAANAAYSASSNTSRPIEKNLFTTSAAASKSFLQGLPKPKYNTSQDLMEQKQQALGPNLFASLPKPRYDASDIESSESLPASSRSAKTVKITVPSLSQFKDSEDSEPIKKKPKPSPKGSGLFALLPPPKHLTVKETKRALVPHVLTKKPSAPQVTSASSVPVVVKKPSLELISHGYPDSGDDSEEESETPQDFFSLNTSDDSSDLGQSIAVSSLHTVTEDIEQPNSEIANDEPLAFVSGSHSSAWKYTQTSAGPARQSSPQQSTSQEFSEADDYLSVVEDDLQLDDEALQRLCGRRAKKQDMEFINVSGAELLPDPKEWLVKQLSQEQPTMRSHSHKKNDGPTSQQRRKHQITYLAFQAKENELELKNQWSQNRMSRKQTQSKYGF